MVNYIPFISSDKKNSIIKIFKLSENFEILKIGASIFPAICDMVLHSLDTGNTFTRFTYLWL